MSKLFVVLKKDILIGVFDKEDKFEKKKEYTIEEVSLNEILIKPNQIIFKGKNFDLSNIDEPLPMLDVSDPTYL